MTLRERFNRIVRFQAVDRLPLIEIRDLNWVRDHRWRYQGMPADCNPFEYFGLDEATDDRATQWLDVGRGLEYVDIDLYALPRFETAPIREDGDYYYDLDIRTGVILRRMWSRTSDGLDVKVPGIPPVKNREDWLEYKKRYDPYTPERYPHIKQYGHELTVYPLDYPETWEEAARDTHTADHMVTMHLYTGYNFISNAIGAERLLLAVIDEAEWIHEMMDHFGWFTREASRKAFETARLDFVQLDDDTPPRTVQGELLVSPKMFLGYVGEGYRETLSLLAANGIELVQPHLTRHRAFDEQIVQMVVDAGLTPMLLADAVGEFSVAERRKQYGGRYPIRGGMDGSMLIEGERAIDEMVDRVFTDAVGGGYFPTMMDRYGTFLEVPLKNYEYYVRAFRKANGM